MFTEWLNFAATKLKALATVFKRQIFGAITPYQLPDPQDGGPSFSETSESIYLSTWCKIQEYLHKYFSSGSYVGKQEISIKIIKVFSVSSVSLYFIAFNNKPDGVNRCCSLLCQ
jgi:hypothetical protein